MTEVRLPPKPFHLHLCSCGHAAYWHVAGVCLMGSSRVPLANRDEDWEPCGCVEFEDVEPMSGPHDHVRSVFYNDHEVWALSCFCEPAFSVAVDWGHVPEKYRGWGDLEEAMRKAGH